MEARGWVSCHGGSVLFALRTIQPYRWGPDENGCRMLRSRGLKNGWILETAEAARYPDAGIDRQLQGFQNEIRDKSLVTSSGIDDPLPRLKYTSIHGYTLDLTWRPHRSDPRWPHPPRFPDAPPWSADAHRYRGQAKIDGEPVNYSRAAWPLLENPWVRQAAGGALLTLQIDGRRRVYDFDRWRVLSE